MELLQLEHFLAVAEEGSFTRAAARVCRTHPAISQSVKKLEEAIGVPLFARDIAELSLTEAGRAMVDSARRLLNLRDDAIRQVGELRSSRTLTIAAHEAAALYLLPPPLRRYFERFPRVKVGIHRRHLDEIPRQVLDGEFDLGFITDEPPFQELRSVLVYSDEMTLIASPRHPLTHRPRVRVKDLGSESFMVHQGCVVTEQILRLFEAHATPCNIAAELWSVESIKHFVQQDVGLAFVPRISVLHELAGGTLVSILLEGLHMPRRIFMVYPNRGYISDSAQRFIEVMDEFKWNECLPRPEAHVVGHRAGTGPIQRLHGSAS